MTKNNNKTAMNYIFIILIGLVILYLCQRYQKKLDRENMNEDYDLIQKYLLMSTDDYRLNKSSKPILWLYVPHSHNSRNWLSFGSRSSDNLNQPYLYLCVKSIIEKCDHSFYICLIDDYSFSKLLPTGNINMNKLSYPMKKYIIDLGLTKLLYMYGGIKVPISFVCNRDLISLYYQGTENDTPFLCEFVNRNITSTYLDFYPSIEFMGTNRENPVIGELIEFMQTMISRDYTDEINFLGEFDIWCDQKRKENKIRVICGSLIGTKTTDNKQILIDHLLSEDYIHINKKTYGIYIPQKELMSRHHYNWFLRMSPQQVLEGNMILSKYILLANVPKGNINVVEKMRNKKNRKLSDYFKDKWIRFWQVPSGAPVWGMKPTYLGYHVQGGKYPANVPGP
jgi:hypothetical protein